jgi:hypothetical protein
MPPKSTRRTTSRNPAVVRAQLVGTPGMNWLMPPSLAWRLRKDGQYRERHRGTMPHAWGRVTWNHQQANGRCSAEFRKGDRGEDDRPVEQGLEPAAIRRFET